MKTRYGGLIAAALLAFCLAAFPAAGQKNDQAELALRAATKTETVDGDLKSAIEQYKKIAALPGAGRLTVATALLRMGQCHEKLGQTEARAAYERLVREFGDQAGIVAQARARLAALGGPGGARSNASGGGPVARRILADATIVGKGSLATDGKSILAFDWNTGDVIQHEIAGENTKRIKNTGSWSETEQPIDDPVFSRDGKLIAVSTEKLTEQKEWLSLLRVRNLDGSASRTLLSEKDYVYPTSWYPDSSAILANLIRGPVAQMARISTADGSVRVLKIIPDWFSLDRTALSPDGRWIAFSLQREAANPHSDIYLMDADGGNETLVAEHPAEDQLLVWAPDGKGLVFLSDRSGTWDIWRIPIAEGKPAGEPELLKKDFGNHVWDVLGITPDGSLYYRINATFGRLFTGEIDLETGKTISPPAPVATRFTSPPVMISWSPDGKDLLYLSNRGYAGQSGSNVLTIRSAATGEERFLTPRLRGVNQISWTPDSRSIVALGAKVKGLAFYRIDAQTGELTELGGEGVAPRLCPDGKTLLYVKGGPYIVKRDLETGAETKVIDIKGMTYGLSPDGREISYVDPKDGALKAISLDGGQSRLIKSSPAQAGTWTRDGRYIIVLGGGERWRIPARGGDAVKLDIGLPKLQWFTLNPDNRRFAFGVSEESKSELWVLENFLPPAKAGK